MTHLSRLGLVPFLVTALAGCPIYDDEDHPPYPCFGEDCGANPSRCATSADCGLNETCGADETCHTGDCTYWGCAAGRCVITEDDTARCSGDPPGGSGGNGGAGGSAVWCGNPDDCAEGETCAPDGTCRPDSCDEVGCIYGFACSTGSGPPACEPTNPAACGADADCAAAGAGYACVSGVCTTPADLCFDQGQCAAGAKCVAGKCTTACADDDDCGDSYRCDRALGICAVPAKACTITNDCGGPNHVCVDGACVPRSDEGACEEAGTVWVENGCIPDQAASFTCAQDGVQDSCASGSICLHHSCYISCAPPNATACDNLPSLNVCKAVTTSSGSHEICGASDNFGNECDPQNTVACNAGICIDGYCK